LSHVLAVNQYQSVNEFSIAGGSGRSVPRRDKRRNVVDFAHVIFYTSAHFENYSREEKLILL
jgi:hypothetical protein